LKRIALVLCAVMALGSGAVASAQAGKAAAQIAAGNAVGTAASVDETTLSLGDASAPAKAANAAAGTSTLAYSLRMVLVLALVLAAIYGVYRLMKSLSKPRTEAGSAVKLLASTSLGTGRSLHVVALGSKAYLVGATDASVNLVTEVLDKEYLDALILEAATSPERTRPGTAGDFGELLSKLLGGRRADGGIKGRAGKQRGSADFLAGQRERLRKF
jgi:flagellar protein FliO/FliZ